jgi:hypothetical protein
VSLSRVLVRCDGAVAPAALAGQAWTGEATITTHGPTPDLNLRVQSLARILRSPVGRRAADLVRIATYAYSADQLISRGGTRDAHAAKWRRHLALCILVNDPAYWSDPDVQQRLVATLQFLTEDHWEFAFSQADPEQGQLPLDTEAHQLHEEPGSVVLFSGGADSLGVLLETAARGERPLAVGHWPVAAHQHRQQRLLSRAQGCFPVWSFPPLGFVIHGQGAEPAERTQRTRAFLYASLGAAVASELGVEQVYLADNGPVSLNLPINAQLVGALASRSTHPKFLAAFNHLADGMFEAPVRVTNPLWNRTRAEGLAILQRLGCEPLLQATLSCSQWSRLPAAKPQCGTCSQCVDRRFATVAAGLEPYDRSERYVVDIFHDALKSGPKRTVAESYVRFAQDIYQRGDDELVSMFPQLVDGVLPDDPDAEGTLQTLIDLLKRHAETTIRVLEDVVRRDIPSLVSRGLPPTCLLRLAVGPGTSELAGAGLATEAPATTETETGGQSVPVAERAEPRMAAANVFARVGDVWNVTYRGKTVHLKHEGGLSRIAGMLAEPGREFTAAELIAATESVAPGMLMSTGRAETEGLHPVDFGSYETLISNEDRRKWKEEASRLFREAEAARDAGDQERAAAAEEDMHGVLEHLKATTGLGGKLRKMETEATTKHNSMNAALRRALKKIDSAHRDLAHHLRTSLQRQGRFSYAPDSPIEWDVRLH